MKVKDLPIENNPSLLDYLVLDKADGSVTEKVLIQKIVDLVSALPPSLQATQVTDDTTVSIVDVVAVGMTLTPLAGTYLVWFSGSSKQTIAGANLIFESIYVGGVKVDSSEVSLFSSNRESPFCSIAKVTVNGSQNIEGRWRVSAGTGTMHQRNLTALKVGS